MSQSSPSPGMPHRRMPLLVLLVALLALALAPPTASQASKRVHGPRFVTVAPSGWKVTRGRANGWWQKTITSPRAGSGIANAVRIHVYSIPVRGLRGRIRKPVPHDPGDLVDLLGHFPQGAQPLDVVARAVDMRLAGAAAAYSTVKFNLDNTVGVQNDTATVRRGRVYLIEMVADDAQSLTAFTALNALRTRWRWR